MFLRNLIFLAVFDVFISVTNLQAQEKPAGQIHGYAFGDYYYIVQHSDSSKNDLNGFQLRRVYLFYDHKLSENFVSQFLIEGNETEFTPSGKYGVFIKTAYLEWKEIIPEGSMAIGLVPTPTWVWGWSERIWNYRAIEKTIADLHKHGNATDIGLVIRGKFDSEGDFGYVAMVGNGAGQKPETNRYKKVYGSLYVKPVKQLILEGYADFEGGPDKKTNHIFKGFIAYQQERFTLGVEAYQRRNKGAGISGVDEVPSGISSFIWGTLNEKLNAFARYDFYNPDTKISNSGLEENFFVAGFDYVPNKNVHLMPNILVTSYSPKLSGAPKPDSDVIPRVTFYYIYK